MPEWATYSSTRLGNIHVARPASNINLLFLPGGQRAVLKDVNDYLNQNQISTAILIFESKQNHKEENIVSFEDSVISQYIVHLIPHFCDRKKTTTKENQQINERDVRMKNPSHQNWYRSR